jgi:hypothetical protein
MNLESKSTPNLVNKDHFSFPENKVKINLKINLNIILLILFVLFTIFFLYNCKYGFFKSDESKIIPFNLYEKN